MKKERIENNFYPTEQKLTQLMLRHWDLRLECDKRSVPFYPVILEPCNGKGDISRLFPNVVTNDIVSGSDYQLDATLKESWNQFPEIDWVVTNPPFVHAPIILPLAYEKAKSGVISLLRLSYLEPCANRAAWLKNIRLLNYLLLALVHSADLIRKDRIVLPVLGFFGKRRN